MQLNQKRVSKEQSEDLTWRTKTQTMVHKHYYEEETNDPLSLI